MIGKDFNYRNIIPAHYHLGMWWVQFFQRKCSLCLYHNANVTAVDTEYNQREPIGAVKGKFAKISSRDDFYFLRSQLLCSQCHDDTTWLQTKCQLELISSVSHSVAHSNISSLDTIPSLKYIDLVSATPYLGYIQRAIIAFKYNENLNALPVLVHAIRQLPRPQNHFAKNSVILAMPTTNRRLKSRGFDSVNILAYYLSKHWNIPVWNGVSRIDTAVSQQGLTRSERRQNVVNAFKAHESLPVKKVILFDDVVTTGSTLKSLASYLHTIDPNLLLSAYTIAFANKQVSYL